MASNYYMFHGGINFVLKPKVSVVKVSEDIYSAVSRAIEIAGGMEIKKGDKVVIKINLCNFRDYTSGATTDPRVLGALVNHIKTVYSPGELYVVESDATSMNADILFKWLGFEDMANEHGFKLVNLTKDAIDEVTLNGRKLKKIKIAKTIIEADYLISLSKLKTHLLTKVTCGLKNMFGAIPIKRKIIYHRYLDDAIVDANMAMKVDFSVVDGIISLEGEKGPTYGYPKKTGLIIAGKDIVAVDSVCARILGFNPLLIGHIRKAWLSGVGEINAIIEGDGLESVGSSFDLVHAGLLKLVYWLKARM
ncbi:MAG: hypothetical protein DRN81_00315 [Thermoproteota archaeon]|nr:MAG: hypothetical protein DRN81_00315 [Candidatus Korarchaeota archaeon]